MGRLSGSRTYETFELSAYTEQTLLDAGTGNGSNLGVGDCFTMPTENDAVITVTDNDGYLSGDSKRDENATDRSGQTADITVDGVEVGNGGQIYAEQFFWVRDDAGNWYIMLEIEQENASGDYFVFYDYCGFPAEGANLTVVCSRNITTCWEPRYDDMMQVPPFAPPIALNDLIEIGEDDAIGGADAAAQLNILANDFDVDSAFALTSVTNGAIGQAFTVTTAGGVQVSVTIQADGTLNFDASGQFDALNLGDSDSFTIEYTIGDADGGSSTASVTVVINGAPDGPVAVADNFSTTEGGSVSGNLLDNDEANGGTLTIVSLEANGQTFEPGDSFEVTTDGGRTGTVTVGEDGSFTFTTDGNFADLTTGETDTVTLSYTTTNGVFGENLIVNGDFESHGTLTRGSGENRWDVFESIEGWSTPAGQLEIQQGSHGGTPTNSTTNSVVELDSHDATDTNASISQTVEIAADGTFQLSFDYSPRQNGSLIGETSGIVVFVNGEAVSTMSSDTLGYQTYTLSLDLSAGANTIGFGGTGVDDTYGALLDNVELRAVEVDTATVVVTINGENEGPVAADDGFAVTEVTGGTFADVTGNVLDNDTDADGDALSVTAVNGDAGSVGQAIAVTSDTNGFAATVVIAADGSVTLSASDEFAALTNGESDTVTVSYEVSDGAGGVDTATVTLTVNGSNEGPVAADDFYSVDEGPNGVPTLVDNLLTNDSDADGDTLTIVSVAGSADNIGTAIELETDDYGILVHATVLADGTITLVADAEAAALPEGVSDTVEFAYQISDGNGGFSSATVSYVINGANIAPVVDDQAFSTVEQADGTIAPVSGNLLTNATDADGDDISILSINGDEANVGQTLTVLSNENGYAAEVTISANGDISLNPSTAFAALNAGESETVTVSFEITDENGGTDTATATLTVEGIDGNGGGGGGGGGGGTGQGNVSYNIVFVVDSSSAAVGTAFGSDGDSIFDGTTAAEQNLNGDAIMGSRLDAELFTVQQISNLIDSLELSDDVDIGVIAGVLDFSTQPLSGFSMLTDGSGNATFEPGESLSDAFNGVTGNSIFLTNSAISGANAFLSTATQDDAYGTTVNLVYVLGASTGTDFNPLSLGDTDANLAGELAELDQLYGAEVDTMVFTTGIATAPGYVAMEGLGDGVVNEIGTGTDLQNMLASIESDLTAPASSLVNPLLDDATTTVDGIIG